MLNLDFIKPFRSNSLTRNKRRRKLSRRKARHHLLQTLERRDHPGSMLEVTLIGLLGDREGDSNDPIDLMLQSAEAMRQQQDQYRCVLPRRCIDDARDRTNFRLAEGRFCSSITTKEQHNHSLVLRARRLLWQQAYNRSELYVTEI